MTKIPNKINQMWEVMLSYDGGKLPYKKYADFYNANFQNGKPVLCNVCSGGAAKAHSDIQQFLLVEVAKISPLWLPKVPEFKAANGLVGAFNRSRVSKLPLQHLAKLAADTRLSAARKKDLDALSDSELLLSYITKRKKPLQLWAENLDWDFVKKYHSQNWTSEAIAAKLGVDLDDFLFLCNEIGLVFEAKEQLSAEDSAKLNLDESQPEIPKTKTKKKKTL